MFAFWNSAFYCAGGTDSVMSTSIACIAFNKGKILIAHRNPTGDMGSRWEFPGGKVDAGENDEQSIVREMREEFSVAVTVGKKICESEFFHKEKKCFLHAYEIFVEHDGIEKPFVLTEHTEYRWVKIDDIPKDNFVDSDLAIYENVKKFIKEKYNA